ncbi:MAG: hypothetical protein QOJ32_2336 [Frankiaceae bacterium]|jgi:hypothetical protein|nr:hypothetical protein [Frankiaceae bacterium]MDQ1648042.1 hypothetical protein [Frankiaceae bacterium]MDQ1673060.1 hypothetical protein [Frankiaceae bacterium]
MPDHSANDRSRVSSTASFDRLRPRQKEAAAVLPTQTDNEGKRALFSTSVPKPAFGSVTVQCTSCDKTSVLSPSQAGRLLLTTVHMPGVRRHHVSWVKCPACGRRSWSRLKLQL